MDCLLGKIVQGEDEFLIRQYCCFSERRTERNNGALDLFVTNRRLIFQTAGNVRNCRNLTHVEVAVENVEGMKFYDNRLVEKRDNRKKLVWLAFLYLLFSGLTWVASLFWGGSFPKIFGMPSIVSILVCYGIICLPILYFCLRSVESRSTTFIVVTKNLGDFVAFTSADRFDGSLSFSVNADAKTEQMLNELGALLCDIRHLSESELAQKWLNRQ